MASIHTHPQLAIIRELAKAHKRRVYLVGGFLRDNRLGKDGTDFDFAVDKNTLAFARAFARRIKGAYVVLDDEYGSARIVKRQGDIIWTFDFTDFRGPTIQRDLALRDFTINTFCVDISDGKEFSPPQAAKDLKAKAIRMVGPKAFSDDPLRLLRAFSLAAQTGFKIERLTLARIKKDMHLIERSAMERVREELFKVLTSARAFKTLQAMDKIGLLPLVMPHITVMYGVKQGGYHHLDVWKHTLNVVEHLEHLAEEMQDDPRWQSYLNQEIGGAHSRLALLKMAAILHDIGKPQTRKKEGSRMTFHTHEHVGAGITRLAARHLKVSVKERYFLEDVVRMHLRPGYLSNFKRPTPKAVFRYLREAKQEGASIALLAIADQRATQGPLTTAAKTKHHEAICRMVIGEFFKEESKPVRQRLITGHDLIKKLKLKPSPLFTKILGAVEEAQALGKISTKEQALDYARLQAR